MKNVNYHTYPFNKPGLEQLVENLKANLITVIDATDCDQAAYHMTIKPNEFLLESRIENDDWSLSLPIESNETIHVRGVKLEERSCLVLWRAKYGNAHGALKELKGLIRDFMEGTGPRGFKINISNNAWLTGYMVKANDDYYDVIQLPTWTKAGEAVTGRTPYTLDELHANETELFFNNIWLVLEKDTELYQVDYDDKEHQFTILSKDKGSIALDPNSLPFFEINCYEEVNYNSPAMSELGLLPPGQTTPEMVYSDATGRQVAVIEEKFEGVAYSTYVLSHGQENITDQITMGPQAVFNEQLIEILIHRYTKLNSEIPDEANVKTIEALEAVKAAQAERYARRKAEAANVEITGDKIKIETDGDLAIKVPQGCKVVGLHEGKAIITDIHREENLPRDAEGTVADLTPAE